MIIIRKTVIDTFIIKVEDRTIFWKGYIVNSKTKKKTNNSKHHLLIEIDEQVRDKFKQYCKGQNVSIKLGLTTLMESAVRRNVKIIHRVAI